jgi:hypothetical protein
MTLIEFLDALDQRRAPYRLNRVRDAIMVEIATPGTRWEVEFLDGGAVEVERFQSDGSLKDAETLSDLFAALE